jgi:glycosyltransferase involved in cell wall biosynthesis
MQKQEAQVFERAALVLALSPHTAAVLGRRFPGIESRLRTLICPVDTNEFRPVEASEAGPFLLLTARIRDPRKNVNMLLRAFARVRALRPDLRLVITGDAPLPETVALAAHLGLAEAVEFRGNVPRAEVVRLCQSAALFTLPSLQEGLGISALEAIACGVPVVATRCGGPEGLVIEGQTGWLVPNNDEAAFAEAVLQALADPERLRAMRETCRHFAEQELARPVVEGKLLAALREVFPEHFA